jgi:K+-transporting ATPase ATPase C chain
MHPQIRPAIMAFLVLTALTGLAYPLLVGGLAWAFFPARAGGSLLRRDGRVAGSLLIGQSFTDPGDFWGRPSAAEGGGSNLSPGSPELRRTVQARVERLRGAGPVPVDLVTASGSGLDPHISPAAASFQAARVARARGLDEGTVRALAAACTEGPQLGLLGEPRVNVLKLNLALDALQGR